MPEVLKESQLDQAKRETRDLGRKRIALINPPSSFLTDDRVFFSLGLLYLAGVAREAGHDVSVVDLAGRGDYERRAVNLARQDGYDLYGVTATSPQFGYALNIQRAIRRERPDSRVVIGGPHATVVRALREKKIAQLLQDDPSLSSKPSALERRLNDLDPNFATLAEFDQVIAGEEFGIFEALKGLRSAQPQRWTGSPLTENLDELPYPARDLIDMNGYTFQDNGKPKFEIDGGPATSVISQRGCPFNCAFCSGRSVDQFRRIRTAAGNYRAHSPERMVEELNMLNRTYGLERFMIYDDELNLERGRFQALMTALRENNSKRVAEGQQPYRFRGFVKSELFARHPEQAQLMVDAGFGELLSGFESGSDRILRGHVRKNTTTDINLAASRLAFKHGMKVKALAMVGHPTETYEDVRMTEEFLDKIGAMARHYGQEWDFDVTVLMPFPGSPIYDGAVPNTGRFAGEYPRVYGDGALYMKQIDFSKVPAPYKTNPGDEVVNTRTAELSGPRLLELRTEMDGNLRQKYSVERARRAHEEHSMGQP